VIDYVVIGIITKTGKHDLVVGSIGVGVNLFIYYWCIQFLQQFFNPQGGLIYLSAIISFVFAMTHNFYLNKVWTFREQMNDQLLQTIRQYFRFSVVALTGLAQDLLESQFFDKQIDFSQLL